MELLEEKAYSDYNFHFIYQKLHQFCVVDMGGFYLDVLKDRLYTMPRHSVGRRSAQTAMYHILHALVRWLAPVLTFTAEEIWKLTTDHDREQVFLTTWYEGWPHLPTTAATFDNSFWNEVLSVRQEVSRQLESVRMNGEIGSALDADVTVYCVNPYRDYLESLDGELRFVFITSNAQIEPLEDKPDELDRTELDGVFVEVMSSPHEKCIRCWHRRPEVGRLPDHPQICSRCLENISGDGEFRLYV